MNIDNVSMAYPKDDGSVEFKTQSGVTQKIEFAKLEKEIAEVLSRHGMTLDAFSPTCEFDGCAIKINFSIESTKRWGLRFSDQELLEFAYEML